MIYTTSNDTSFKGHYKHCAFVAHRMLKKEKSIPMKTIMVLAYPFAALCWVHTAYKQSKAGEFVRVPSKE